VAKAKEKTLNEHRQEGLGSLYAALDKQFGEGTGRPIPEREVQRELARVSTGSLSIDHVTGGGIPKGRVTEIFGNESGGKTTLALTIIAQAQKGGGVGAFVDAEHTFDPSWAAKLGVDVAKMLYHDPESGEEALTVVELMLKSKAVDVIVVDSVSALVPLAELQGEMGEAQMGLQARLMSQAMRKLTSATDKSQAALIFINQLREKLGNTSWGPSETTTGGRALKFYASLRLDVRRTEQIKSQETVLGHQMRVLAVKNKTAPPFRRTFVPLLYERGIDGVGEFVDLGVSAGLIEKSGAWYAFRHDPRGVANERMGQGREAAVEWLRTRPESLTKMRAQLLNHLETGEVYGKGLS